MQAYQKAQGEVGSALSRLLAITEAYPDLKANENFKELQAQLEGTENRISVERKRFNDTARAYNTAIRTFPRNLLAGMFGFDKRPYFESEEGADKAPKVEFNFYKSLFPILRNSFRVRIVETMQFFYAKL